MSWLRRRLLTQSVPECARVLCALLLTASWAMAQPAQNAPPSTGPAKAALRLRVVGGLASVPQFTNHEEPFWTKELPRLTQGKYTADIAAFDRAGIPPTEILRMMQLGVVSFGTVMASAIAALHPQFSAADLPGLNPDVASLKASVAAFRPYLEKTLLDQFGVELLAVYTYPAQVVSCKKPFASLADLSGRRVRVSSVSQADYVSALGGIAVNTAFADQMINLQSGNVECTITGAMSGNVLGLHKVTSTIHTQPINWGIAIFAVNRSVWESLPSDLRMILRRELTTLEAAIWQESERDTVDGLACNQGASSCKSGQRGNMQVLAASAADEKKSKEILASTVLPRWIKRCGAPCVQVWSQILGPAHGVMLPGTPTNPAHKGP